MSVIRHVRGLSAWKILVVMISLVIFILIIGVVTGNLQLGTLLQIDSPLPQPDLLRMIGQ